MTGSLSPFCIIFGSWIALWSAQPAVRSKMKVPDCYSFARSFPPPTDIAILIKRVNQQNLDQGGHA